MRLRTRLILALLLLSALPLAVIVLYNYVSAQRAVREAVASEADQLTRDMEGRLAEVRLRIRSDLERLGEPLMRRYYLERLADAEPPMPVGGSKAVLEPPPAPDPPEYSELSGLHDLEELVPSIEVQLPSEVMPSDDRRSHRRVFMLSAPAIRQLAVGGAMAGLEVAESLLPEGLGLGSEGGAEMAGDLGALIDEAFAAATTPHQDSASRAAREERLEAVAERLAARFGARGHVDIDLGDSAPTEASVEAAFEAAAEASAASAPFAFGLETRIREGGRELGTLLPRLDPQAVLRRVMGPLDRRRGEIPFAITPGSGIETLDSKDREALSGLDLEAVLEDHGGAPESDSSAGLREDSPRNYRIDDDWVVVLSEPQPGGLVFGIASPVGESLTAVRKAAARNLVGGLGLLSLAILGVLPLARRLSGDLEHLTEGAKRVAAGDLDTAVDVRSEGEIGQLASAFNHMAHDLKTNQGRLVEQALKERLLAEELARKDEELEAARRFQLSMLPKTLPAHPDFEVAVAMRTATEVGGDYYDFDRPPDGGLTVAIGDATGHGAVAGRMVTVVKSLFTAESRQPPERFLQGASRTVRRMDLGRMAMALAVAHFDDTGFTVSSAGMPPVYVLRGAGSSGESGVGKAETGRSSVEDVGVEEVVVPGMPLGGIEGTYRARSVRLRPGETAVLMSDGLPEQCDAAGDPLGYQAIREFLESQASHAPEAIISGLLELLDLWTDGEPPGDDVTFVAVARR